VRLLRGLDGGRFAGQDAVELATRADAELGEALVQVVLGGAGADEQPGGVVDKNVYRLSSRWSRSR
jgi:hypothetical protein